MPPRRGFGVTFFVPDLVQERNGGYEVPPAASVTTAPALDPAADRRP
jgi:hypothetical protein